MNDLIAGAVQELANWGWHSFQAVNTRVPEGEPLRLGRGAGERSSVGDRARRRRRARHDRRRHLHARALSTAAVLL